MRLAAASVVCLTTAILMLVIRGPADWSRPFGLSWYGVFGAAVVFAMRQPQLQPLRRVSLRSVG
jgi:hypothetical protein